MALIVWTSLIGEVHVLVAALVMFVLLPFWALAGRRATGLAASVIAVGAAFWIVVVTGLAYIASVRYSLIFVAAVVGLLAARKFLPRAAVDSSPGEAFMRLWDVFERPGESLASVWKAMRHRVRESWSGFREHYGTLGMILTVIALVWALGYGSWPWLHQVSPGTANGYTNLLRMASFASNTGVYAAGTAPTGLPALGSVLSTAFFLPPVNVLRFLYPLADVFTVMASGVLSHQLTRSGRASSLVMFLVSVSSLAHLGFPLNFESPLAMHWADILVLLALAEALAWSKTRVRAHAVFVALCLMGATLTSPPEAALGFVVLAILTVGDSWMVIGYSAVGGLMGLIPLAVGVASRVPLNPDGWLTAGFPPLVPVWQDPQSASYWIPWMALILVVIHGMRPATALNRRYMIAVGITALGAALWGFNGVTASALLWSGLLGLMVVIAGIDILLVSASGNMRVAWGVDVTLAALAVLGLLIPSATPTLKHYEPPLAALATLKIEESLQPYQWLVVAPVGQYSEVLSRGWHEELGVFVQTYSLAQAKSAAFQFKNDRAQPILTPNIFLFVEPRLFPSGTPVSLRDLKLRVASGNGMYQGQSLAAVESRAYYWAMAYHRSHPKSSSVYMRGKNLMILWIRQ